MPLKKQMRTDILVLGLLWIRTWVTFREVSFSNKVKVMERYTHLVSIRSAVNSLGNKYLVMRNDITFTLDIEQNFI